MGESAGGASIIHQITAFGGSQGPVPFQQAIVQSPAYVSDLPVQQHTSEIPTDLKCIYHSASETAPFRKVD